MKNQKRFAQTLALALSGVLIAQPMTGSAAVITVGAGESASQEVLLSGPGAASIDVNRFVLPEEARVLVIVEGTEGSNCNVYAYEKSGDAWMPVLTTSGVLGANGMSNHRTMGDKTTPIGVFQMNTPFGQKEALEGFPSNYIQVTESYVWTDATNKLVNDASEVGEHVGTAGYAGYYDYVIDAGFNPYGLEKQGSALFLHCSGAYKESTSGCVAIDSEQMIAIMRLYGTYGDGACFIAQAPKGTFDQIYDTFGTNQGLSPEGYFQ